MEELRADIEKRVLSEKKRENELLQEKNINWNELLVVSGRINGLMECLILTYKK